MDEEGTYLTDSDLRRLSRMKERLDVEFESEMEVDPPSEVDAGLSDCPHRENGKILKQCDSISYCHVLTQMIDNNLRIASTCHIEHPVLYENILETAQNLAQTLTDQLTEMRLEVIGEL